MSYIARFNHPTVGPGHLLVIRKAKRRVRAGPTTKRLDALQETMSSAVSVDLFHGIKKFKSKIDNEKVYEAWTTGSWAKVMEVIPWETMTGSLEGRLDKLDGVVKDAWGISEKSLPVPKDPQLRYDTANPRVRDYFSRQSASLVTNISRDSAANIQSWAQASFDRALTPRQVATQIKDSIGLLPAHQVAVDRYRAGLLAGGTVSTAAANGLASEYADRLLNYRAQMIARTETRMATNFGQLAVWQKAADEGLINRSGVRKVWVVGSDPCEICDPMDGVAVGLDESWYLLDGTPVYCPPWGTHPNCFCGMELEFVEVEGQVSADESGDEDAE